MLLIDGFIWSIALGLLLIVVGLVNTIGVWKKFTFFWDRHRMHQQRQFWGDGTIQVVYILGGSLIVFLGLALILSTVWELLRY